MSHYLSQSQPVGSLWRVTSATVWNDEQVQVKYTDCLVTDQTHAPHFLCLQDPHKAWSPVRHTHTPHTPSTYKTHTKHGYQSERSETHTPHTISTSPSHQSETVTPYTLCLQGPHETWSPVSHTHPTLSAYKEPYKAWSTIWEMHTVHLNAINVQ